MENGLERVVENLLPKPRQAPPQPEPRRGGWADVKKNIGSGFTQILGEACLGFMGGGVCFRERLTFSVWNAKQGT